MAPMKNKGQEIQTFEFVGHIVTTFGSDTMEWSKSNGMMKTWKLS
jgi:hypothetical protein